MARRKQSQGKCAFCGREIAKGGMTRHLKACPQRKEAINKADQGEKRQQGLYHLLVQDAWQSKYWLHLEISGAARMEDLDHYLRAIWLECCGHMSMFTIGGWRGEEIPMTKKITWVFKRGVEVTHIYDFGTSSETLIRFVDKRKGAPLTEHPIYLMARNDSPKWECMECGEPASKFCLECSYGLKELGTLCDKHAREHPHRAYGDPLPLANSPRIGLCAYCGPATPPY